MHGHAVLRADLGGHIGARRGAIARDRAQLVQLLHQTCEIVARRGQQQVYGVGFERELDAARAVRDPAPDAVRRQASHVDRRRPPHEIRLGFLPAALDQGEDGVGTGVLEIGEQGIARPGLLAQLLDTAQHDHAAFGQHGRSVHEAVQPLGVQLAGGTLVHVEITQPRVHRRVQQRRDRLVLQDVLVAVEVVDGVGWARLEAPEELVQGDRPHRAGKLPPREGG